MKMSVKMSVKMRMEMRMKIHTYSNVSQHVYMSTHAHTTRLRFRVIAVISFMRRLHKCVLGAWHDVTSFDLTSVCEAAGEKGSIAVAELSAFDDSAFDGG